MDTEEVIDMKCPYCGAGRMPGDRYCAYCGSSFETDAKPQAKEPPVIHVHYHQETKTEQPVRVERVYIPRTISPKKRWIALVLCLLLGNFGAHRFYLAKTGTGVLYLLTHGFGGIGTVIDFLALLLGSPRDKDGLLVK